MDKVVIAERSLYRLFGDISEFGDYTDFLNSMLYHTEEDEVIIEINSGGGRIDIGMMIVNAIKNCKAHVKCKVVHPSYSMASIIALSGDELEICDYSFLMFHNYSTGARGKGGEFIEGALSTDKYITAMFYDACQPFLTMAELKKLSRDQDIYIHYDDPTLSKRQRRHFK